MAHIENLCPEEEQGYSIFELVAVVAVLGILSSVAVPQIGNIVNGSKIDSIQAKLNAVAADCLQKSRTGSISDPVDDSIISKESLENTGYELDSTRTTCEKFGVKPKDNAPDLLPPMSFQITGGNLLKASEETGSGSGFYCKRWAGAGCGKSADLEALTNHINAVAAKKQECQKGLQAKLATKEFAGPINKWNPVADSRCPTRPPVDTTSPTCRLNGCGSGGNTVYVFDGNEYADETAARAAQTLKKGADCTNALAALTDPTKGGDPKLTSDFEKPSDCDSPSYFANGKEFSNKDSWKAEMCSVNIKQKQDTNYTDPSAPSKITHCADDRRFYFCAGEDKGNDTDYQACLIKNKSAACEIANDQVRQTGANGKHTNPTAGPAPCGKTFWVCNQIIKDTEAEYEKGCPKPKKPKSCTPNPFYCSWGSRRGRPECKGYVDCLKGL